MLKKGDINYVNNYCGISLLSTLSKLFTGILNERLSHWVEESSKLYEQIGFRKSKITVDHKYVLQAITSKYLCKPRGRCYCLFIAFSKAFDRVPHLLLFHRLITADIHGNFLKILKSMYSQLFACVSTYEGLTNFFKCLIGTQQGCMLSPFLFVLYLNSYIELNYNDGSKGIFLDEMFSTFFYFFMLMTLPSFLTKFGTCRIR